MYILIHTYFVLISCFMNHVFILIISIQVLAKIVYICLYEIHISEALFLELLGTFSLMVDRKCFTVDCLVFTISSGLTINFHNQP